MIQNPWEQDSRSRDKRSKIIMVRAKDPRPAVRLSLPVAQLTICASRTAQKCAPTFGAIPSHADMQKKQQEQADAAEKRDEILESIMQKPALARLNKLEMDDPVRVSSVRKTTRVCVS